MADEYVDGKNARYFVASVSRALDVLDLFGSNNPELSLSEIAKQLKLTRGSAFRVLFTLDQKGWVEKVPGTKKFRRVYRANRFRVGYAMLSGEFPFVRDVSLGLSEAAGKFGVELITFDNCGNAEIALMNARAFVDKRVDFVIEFQPHERVAPIIAHYFAEAKIPCLAIDIPQPGAVFFGADNYRAGLIAGRALGEHALARWNGQVDKVILMEVPHVGHVPGARVTGAVNGIQEVLGSEPDTDVIHVNCGGTLHDGYQVMSTLIRSIPSSARVLVATLTDPIAVGAVRALEEAGRTEYAAVMGQNATIEARMEMRKEGSCLIGSVGYFPEKYGEQIMPLVLSILGGGAVSTAVYIHHFLITKENVDRYYREDYVSEVGSQIGIEPKPVEVDSLTPISALYM
jgi:ribose transport system substrate-binding protein